MIIDIDEYLPEETLNWCRTELLQMDFDPENPPAIAPAERFTPFHTVYLQFRDVISAHLTSGADPVLALSLAPRGAANWAPNQNNHTAI